MNVSASLYGFFWLAVTQILLGVSIVAGITVGGVVPYLHAGIGVVILGWAFVNFRAVRATRAPGRTKRTIAATLSIAVMMVVLGALLWLGVEANVSDLGGEVSQWIGFVHLLFALAIVTQAASTATGYDMWEEHEFEQESTPGVVPMIPKT